MRPLFPLAAATLVLAVPLAAQDLLYSVPATELLHPDRVGALGDVDGDGVAELAIGRRTISGPTRIEVHSGATGAFLYGVSGPGDAQFYGHMFDALDDLSGDGVPDFVVVGAKSGDSHSSNGVIDVRSGASGALFARFAPPAGDQLRESPPAIAIDDVDGDGHPDVLASVYDAALGATGVKAFSTSTGAPLFTIADTVTRSTGPATTRVDDFDGDGVEDFALSTFDFTSGSTGVEIRSGASGALLAAHAVATGIDGDPIVSVADLDGDGRRDLVCASHIEGVVRAVSSASGAVLLTIANPGDHFAFGASLLELGDVDFDGSPDILIGNPGAEPYGAFEAYSLADGHLVFVAESPIEDCCFGASVAKLEGADPEGFVAFAALHFGDAVPDSAYVLRYAPRVGVTFCTATPNSTGLPAEIEALGTTSLAQDHLLLAASPLPPSQFGIFFYGPAQQQVPFGDGFLCIHPGGTGLGRLPVEQANAVGRITHRLDYDAPPSHSTRILPGSTWHFQTWYRDPMGGGTGFNTSNGLTLDFVP